MEGVEVGEEDRIKVEEENQNIILPEVETGVEEETEVEVILMRWGENRKDVVEKEMLKNREVKLTKVVEDNLEIGRIEK